MANELNPIHQVTLNAWMRTELNLKGYELLTFALVYHYSQQKHGMYHGGIGYLSAWMGCSDATTWRTLKSLVAKALIIEHSGTDQRGVKFCNYTANTSKLPKLEGYSQNDEGIVKMNRGYNQNDKKGIINLTNTDTINIDTKNIDNSSVCAEHTAPAEKKRFVAPTIEEITAYIKEKKLNVNPSAFLAHYEANGWKVGRTQMKDWKASVRYWHLTENKNNPAPKARVLDKTFNPFN